MRRLRDKNLVPPTDFTYTDPDNGVRTTSRIYNDWVSSAKDRRRDNNLPIPLDLEAKMNEQLCGILPPEMCERDAGDVKWVDTRFSWADFSEGMKVFSRWGAEGMPLVEEKEANRRAAICVSCPLNVNVSGCSTCHKMASLITGAVAHKKGAHDDYLRACAICKCALRAMVWFPLDILMQSETLERQDLRPDFCWVKH